MTSNLWEKPVDPPSARVLDEAQQRLAGLATPPGALGRLGELGAWVAAAQGTVPPRVIEQPRLVVFAGDHGVVSQGVSAFPSEITGAMVRTFVAGKAGVSALARANGVEVRVLDIGVNDDLDGVPAAVRAHKLDRGSRPINLEDALPYDDAALAIERGILVAGEEISDGADLLMSGDMGIGNTTPAAAMVAAALDLTASDVAGRGTGIDDATLAHKIEVIDQALTRIGSRAQDPIDTLAALGSSDLAATTGYLIHAARSGVPVLLDGLMSVACALYADRIAPGAAQWFVAGHRSTEAAQTLALAALGLEPLLDVRMRLGEGSGAVAALATMHNAVALMRDVALLKDVLGE